jgi:hypothetical protein
VINDEQGAAARGLQACGLAELALFFGRSRAVRSHWLRALGAGPATLLVSAPHHTGAQSRNVDNLADDVDGVVTETLVEGRHQRHLYRHR